MSAVIAYHVTLSTYGFWLPNDPRGSCSTVVRHEPLRAFGEATLVNHRHSVAGRPHDRTLRLAAKAALKYPPVVFDDRQIHSVGMGFAAQVAKSGYRVLACAILPDHAHLVIARHRYTIEQVVRLLRQSATQQLLADGLHPFAAMRLESGRLPSVWGQDFWKTFLFTPADVNRCINYAQRNLTRANRPLQCWPFVVSCDV